MKLKIIVTAAFLAAQSQAVRAGQLLLPAGFDAAGGSSWLAGAVAGYNWQRGSLVFGFEGDISGLNLVSRSIGGLRTLNPVNGTAYPSGEVDAKIDWYGTVRGRLGWTVGAFLFYGTGGLAYGNAALTSNFNLGSFGPAQSTSLSAQSSAVRVGWVAGAGVEYMLNRNLTLSLEYQYVDLGSVNLAAATNTNFAGPAGTVHAQFQAVTVGLSWRFSPPSTRNAFASMQAYNAPPAPSANPWEGIYVGGRAGGAWGNHLTVTPAAVIAAGP